MRKILILGAGLVSRPIVRYFLDLGDTRVTVGSLYERDAKALIDGHPLGTGLAVDVTRDEEVVPLVADCDLVVSLVPFDFHPRVARFAIDHHVHLVTASYLSEGMQALDNAAREAGVIVLNEVGLDPGLDHMSALRIIDDARKRGGRVEKFSSCTGGLPSPEAADNPWKYRFSWSPRGALLAGLNPARYLKNGEVVEIPGPELFNHQTDYPVEGVGDFEMYPNRDSMPYIEKYSLRGIDSIRRGTIRYPGWCRAMLALVKLDLFHRESPWRRGSTWASWTCETLPASSASPRNRVTEFLGIPEHDDILDRMAWVGLFDETPLPDVDGSGVDLLAKLFNDRMSYEPEQRDMVLMRHELVCRFPDGSTETTVSILESYGDPDGDSATSRTVSLPAAIAARNILAGAKIEPGVWIPNQPVIYEPILDELAGYGIRFFENTTHD
ncbi:MAG: saccharopine dehydrogenase NADP-binding domain-containing protein [Acidobacteriota bacterium]|nr:saccharopine dehydrogenase NADP-binding domain-containing protein [Acidobacteriota bacterium]